MNNHSLGLAIVVVVVLVLGFGFFVYPTMTKKATEPPVACTVSVGDTVAVLVDISRVAYSSGSQWGNWVTAYEHRVGVLRIICGSEGYVDCEGTANDNWRDIHGLKPGSSRMNLW